MDISCTDALLRNISLVNFKNYDQFSSSFLPGVNCVLGLNGSGKTNLLDAIYYLCYTKSYFHHSDLPAVQHNEEFFRIEGVWERNSHVEKVVIRMPRGGKKYISVNDADVGRITDFLGQYAAVMVTPDDSNLITGGSEGRRRFLDATLSLVEPDYLHSLLTYQKLLLQRNALLKDFAERKRYDSLLLDAYDSRMAALGDSIWEKRSVFLDRWLSVFVEQFQYFVEAEEEPQIVYSIPSEPLGALFLSNRQTDLKAQRTTVGPHTDDLEFVINRYPLKRNASQGQQKSFLVALKLAQWKSLRDVKGVKPLLLLDDIFDKLDNKRIGKLIELMKIGYLGQVFITDTDADRMSRILKDAGVEANMIRIKNGQIEQ